MVVVVLERRKEEKNSSDERVGLDYFSRGALLSPQAKHPLWHASPKTLTKLRFGFPARLSFDLLRHSTQASTCITVYSQTMRIYGMGMRIVLLGTHLSNNKTY